MDSELEFEIETCLRHPFHSQLSPILGSSGNHFDDKLNSLDNSLLEEYFVGSLVTYRLTISLLSFSLILTLLKRRKYKEDTNPTRFLGSLPGPRSFWLIGNLHSLWSPKERLKTLTSWCLQYGPYFRINFGPDKLILLTSPEAIQKLLGSTNECHLSKWGAYEIFAPFWKDGLVISKAAKWKERRRLMMRAFTFKSFLGYMHVYNKESKELVNQLGNIFRNEEKVNIVGRPIDNLLWKSTLKVICETTMGTDIWDIEGIDKLTSTLHTCKQLCMMRILKPWLMIDWVWNFHPQSKNLKEGAAMLEEFTRKVIHLRKFKAKLDEDKQDKDLEKENELGIKKPFQSMIEEMLEAGFDNEALTEEVQTIITTVLTINGYETTATSIQYVLFLLALHPHHQNICREEVDQVFQDVSLCPDGDLSYEALKGLKHLERCILETLRLFPVAFAFFRKLNAPLLIDDNLELPCGVNVGVFLPGLHRNPTYFPNPDIFNPDRFLPENSSNRSQYAFLPFSSGQRNCIGFKFGLIEIKVTVARLIHNFNVKTSDKIGDVAILPEIVLMPERGYNFVLEERTH